ncbi:MAG: response regulator [Bryobacterales bacterium]|nr:response regulator [Bryobacterales bacterium]
MPDIPAGKLPFRVLLVEDDDDHAELVMRHLRRHYPRHRVIHVHDGEAALDYVMRRGPYADPDMSPAPHLILLDLRLPKLSGVEVLRALNQTEKPCRIPVVVLTTSAAPRDLEAACSYHASRYVVKPREFEEFTTLMKEIGLYWLSCDEPPAGLGGTCKA